MTIINIFKRSNFLVGTLALGLLSLVGANAEISILSTHKSWVAQTYNENGNKVCMIWSHPEKEEGNYTKRGDIYVFVTHRKGSRGKIRFETGYNFAKETTVDVHIDDEVFELVTDASIAWSLESTQDKAMVKAMREGRSMIVHGTSSRGTRTKDTYSLFGFTAAYNAISQACR